jgi:hypothetical protein
MPGGGGGGALKPTSIIFLVVVLVIFFVFRSCFSSGGGREATNFQAQPQPTESGFSSQESASDSSSSGAAAEPFVPPPPSAEGTTWTVMLYQDADDKILEKDIFVDLNEAERIGSTDQVQVVAQVDRYRKGFTGDGNWDSTKRFHLTYDPDLNRVASQEVMDLGEVNMADGQTLVDFVAWAVENYPADRYALILSDHGMGWPGGWTDPDPGGNGPDRIALASALGDGLFLMELDDALAQIQQETAIDKFEMIGLDACLMSHVEVYDALAPYANYAVASQETEPAVGWAYAGFLKSLAENPDMDGAQLSQAIVDSYIVDDQRVLDDQARADMMGGRRGFGLPSAAQVTQQLEGNATLTAVDLSAFPAVMDSLNDLAYKLQESDPKAVAKARTYAQAFTSVFGKSVPPSYLDVGNFAQLLEQATNDPDIAQSVNQLLASIDQAVIAEKHGPNKSGASGVSLYFPNSQLYRSPVAGAESYATVANRFAQNSLWDEFLAYHYTGREFGPAEQQAAPAQGTQVKAPGGGTVQVSPLTLSADEVSIGDAINVSADIQGENIGYIYFFVGYLDKEANSINVADMDYLESPETREVDGVYYPDWGADEFTLDFDWEPVVFAIDDGQIKAEALFKPESYGADFEDATYTVDGVYQYTDGESRYAQMLFQNGELKQVFGYTGPNGNGAPREILPSAGDKFTVLERWMDLDDQGRVVKNAQEKGKTVTFGDDPLTWVDLDAAAGEYIVGFIIEDMDGNQYPAYATVQVR